jgi:hypothetical protein
MYKLALIILFVLFLMPMQITAQDERCQPDLSSVIELLSSAQELLDTGNIDAAVENISEARRVLQLQEALCLDFAPDDAGSSRTNPVPFGQTQSIDLRGEPVQITMLNFTDKANDLVQEMHNRNDPPSDGMRYVVVELNFFCDRLPSESCEFRRSHYKMVGSDGVVHEYSTTYDRGFIDNIEVFGGSEAIISRPFEVGIDETELIFFNDRGDRIFFATE